MKIIVSPSKKMNIKNKNIVVNNTKPIFQDKADYLISLINEMSEDEIKNNFSLNDKMYNEFRNNLSNYGSNNKYTSLQAYSGIFYKSLDPSSFTNQDYDFARNHLFILSGLYGILNAFDEINLYRLPINTNLKTSKKNLSLYKYWSDLIYFKDDELIINLASQEYSKIIKANNIVTIDFRVLEQDKLISSSTELKKMRGLMTRYIITNQITKIDAILNTNLNGYIYNKCLSTNNYILFTKEKN